MASVADAVRQAVSHGRANATGWVRVNCPFCPSRGRTPDVKRSFAFNTRTTGFVCNRCRIKGIVGGRVDLGEARDVHHALVRPEPGFIPLWPDDVGLSISCAPALEYLLGRGVTLAEVELAVMHAAVVGKYAGRVIVPHLDVDGTWWGFTARCWAASPADGVPKVLYPPGMSRAKLYNGHVLGEATADFALLVEGTLDAVPYLGRAAAFLGKPTEEHLPLVLAARRPVVFALDGDAWEESRAWAQRCRLRGKTDVGWVRLPAALDPQTVDPRWLLDAAARSLIDASINSLT